MSNNPQMLGQVTRARSIKPARAKAPAGSPIMINERPHLFSAFRRIGARRDTGGILKKRKAPKTKTDDKTSLSWDMFKERDDAKVDDINLGWNKMIPADQLAEVKAEDENKQFEDEIKQLKDKNKQLMDENKQLEAYAPEAAFEDAPRRVSLDPYSASTPGLRPTWSLEVGHGFHRPTPDEPIAPHRSTYKLADCGLRSTHYTISQDHTSGQEAYKDNLLASFGKRRRTDKPSVPLSGSRLLQRSPNLLPSLATGNDAVAQNEGSGMQKISQENLDSSNNWKAIGSKMPEDTLFFPTETVINYTSDGRDRGDDVVFKRVQRRSRQAQSFELQKFLRRQDRDTSLFVQSGDRSTASLNRRCPRCNRIVSSEWRGGLGGAVTVCDVCGLHYEEVWRKFI